MRLEVRQEFTGVTTAHVAAAFRERSMYESLTDLPFVGRPELVLFERVDDDVKIELRYRVGIDLPGPARAFIDPDKLTFVERSTISPDGTMAFVIVPDHYRDLLTSSGQVRLDGQSDGRVIRHTIGDLKLDLGWQGMLFETQVEEAIVKGFRQSINAQTRQVQAFMVDRYGV